MEWTYKLTEAEFSDFVNKLNYFFEPIKAKIIVDEPLEMFESKTQGFQHDYWKTYNYHIRIETDKGVYETLEGFREKIDIQWQIEHIARTIAFSYWFEKDFRNDSPLGERLMKK